MTSEEKEREIVTEFNRLRGKIAGLIESWGLKSTQERGAISTFKSLSYDSEKAIKELLKKDF